ncbi:MAG TPA: DUF6152 family protein [Gammaproteobacteria bacterium]
MKNFGATRVSAVLLAALLPLTASAHHSLLGYDLSQVVEFEGEVTGVFWRNPHVRITVRAIDDNGAERIWTVEGSPVNAMERAGINEAIVSVGERVKLAGHPSSFTENEIRPVLLTLASGTSYVLDEDSATEFGLLADASGTVLRRNSTPDFDAADLDVEGIFRVWTNRDRHWMQDVRGWWARDFPLTAAARARHAAWNRETDDLARQCLPAGMPEAMMMPFPIEFVDRGDTIVLNIEEWDNSRTIHLDADPNADVAPSRLGYSVGRWEGDTLVVETSGIDYPYFNDQGIPQSEDLRIVERFTLSAGGTKLDWTATTTDPQTFTEPVEMAELHWDWIPGQELKPYNCVVDER